MSKKVLIAAPVHPVLTEGLAANGYDCVTIQDINQDKALKVVSDCVGIITSTRLQIDKQMLDAATNLKWIGRMGSGIEVIDTEYATQKGISWYSSPEGNRNAVAEHALGMLLSLNKRIVVSNNEIKEGFWKREENRGVELDGKTLGIIGFGNTGQAFAQVLSGFNIEIIAYDITHQNNTPKNVQLTDNLNVIFERADIISFHVPLNENTAHYLNESFINKMQKPFVLINTSRGKVVDIQAVYNGLNRGSVSAVCLDVWEEEPIDGMSDMQREYLQKIVVLPNAIITPHIAGYSHESLYKMSKILLDKIVTKQ